MLGSRKPAPVLCGRTTAGFAYVDDAGLVGLSWGLLATLHGRFSLGTASRGFVVHEVKPLGPQLEDIKLGFALHGTSAIVAKSQRHLVTNRPKRRTHAAWAVQHAIRPPRGAEWQPLGKLRAAQVKGP